MDIKDHYRTEFWAGTVSYGKFTEKNWLAIGGIRHPLFQSYKILYNIKKLAFELKFYIDVNLQPTIKGVMINCGNIKKWNGQHFKIKAWEISNKFITTDTKGNEKVCIYKWKKSKYGLYEEDKIYPFTKNLDKYKKEGFVYKEPRRVL